MSNRINQSRRNLFSRRKTNVIRPPWVKLDIEFTDYCTRCDKCIDACETQIIARGDGGFPEINFSRDECTFCGNCSEVCPEPLFDKQQTSPWTIKASIKDNCLAFNGVWCQSCKDACEPRAISFSPQIGKAPQPTINLNSCTGCGACVAPCPNGAIIVGNDVTS
ncbi:ferredoxin-type protein NapF [Shewanella waksmanii]|uniref:ferredoxin-type protein NapF n=1 Tax=Shewanella waksmanii TaxID=213783 RepID=UPI003735E5DD